MQDQTPYFLLLYWRDFSDVKVELSEEPKNPRELKGKSEIQKHFLTEFNAASLIWHSPHSFHGESHSSCLPHRLGAQIKWFRNLIVQPWMLCHPGDLRDWKPSLPSVKPVSWDKCPFWVTSYVVSLCWYAPLGLMYFVGQLSQPPKCKRHQFFLRESDSSAF